MTKDQLLESARSLVRPGPDAAEEYSKNRTAIVAEVDRIMMDRQDLSDLVGDGNDAMMRDNHQNHALFMESVFRNYDPNILVETVLWVFRAYRSHGFQLTYWAAQLNAWLQVIEKKLDPDSYNAIEPFYNWLIVNIPVFTRLTDTQGEQ